MNQKNYLDLNILKKKQHNYISYRCVHNTLDEIVRIYSFLTMRF